MTTMKVKKQKVQNKIDVKRFKENHKDFIINDRLILKLH